MKKFHLRSEFIELRATGYTYDEICIKLKITKPTAIAWGKKFASEIDETQNYLLVKRFGEEIVKRNETFVLYFEQFRRIKASDLSTVAVKRGVARILEKLNSIFGAKITKMELSFIKDNVKEAIFTFSKEIKNPTDMHISLGEENTPKMDKMLMRMAKLVDKVNKRRK
jgi:hypothetical protein